MSTKNEDNNLMERLQVWWEKNQRWATGGAVLLLLIVVGFVGYNRFIKAPKVRKAEEKIFPAQIYLSQDSLNLALQGDNLNMGFLDIAKKYGGTDHGNLAKAYTGLIYLQQGDYDNAIKYLKKFKSKDVFVTAYIYGALGHAYSEKGDLDNAYDYYLKAANHEANEYHSPQFLGYAAMAAEALGNYDDAIDIYNQILDEYPNSIEAYEADKFIAFLEAKV